MCISSGPAEFTATKGYIGEVTHPTHGLTHVLGYQNDAKNLQDGPNALLLPFPSSEPMSEANVINLGEKGKGFLNAVTKQLFADRFSKGIRTLGAETNSARSIVHVFQSGIYHVALSESPSAIYGALERIPENKRPAITYGFQQLLKWYEDTYPGWSLAVCCFDNKDKVSSEPMFWWYKPSIPSFLFFPAVDAHDGGIPNLKQDVNVDHQIVLASDQFEKEGSALEFWDQFLASFIPEEFLPFFPLRMGGMECKSNMYGKLPNGDFAIPVNLLRKHQFESMHRAHFSPSGMIEVKNFATDQMKTVKAAFKSLLWGRD